MWQENGLLGGSSLYFMVFHIKEEKSSFLSTSIEQSYGRPLIGPAWVTCPLFGSIIVARGMVD